MTYADAAKNGNWGTQQMSGYAYIHTLTCKAEDPEEMYKIEHLMEELIERELGSDMIQRVTTLQNKGHFAITMETPEKKRRC